MAPKVVAHRGFKRKYPENTLLAFAQAKNAGANVIELDLQLTKDHQIVVSHDPNTGRVFSKDINIHDSTLADVQQLRTKQEPHELAPTLETLFAWLVKPENDGIQVMLDIKRVNKLDILDVLHTFFETSSIARISDSSNGVDAIRQRLHYWSLRVIVGLWTIDQYDYVLKHKLFVGFQKVIISFMLATVIDILSYSDKQAPENAITGISLLHISSWDRRLFRDIEKIPSDYKAIEAQLDAFREQSIIKYLLWKYVVPGKVKLYFWTVNGANDIAWALNFPFIEGIVTDNPDIVSDVISDFVDLPIGQQNQPGKDVSINARVDYFKAKTKQVSKLVPWSFSSRGIKRNLLYTLFLFVTLLNKHKLNEIKLFGCWSTGSFIYRGSKAIGLV